MNIEGPEHRGTPMKLCVTQNSRQLTHNFMGVPVHSAGMTNKWLKDQGLISVKEQWVKLHYPATAR
jgi:hypothetical protein